MRVTDESFLQISTPVSSKVSRMALMRYPTSGMQLFELLRASSYRGILALSLATNWDSNWSRLNPF